MADQQITRARVITPGTPLPTPSPVTIISVGGSGIVIVKLSSGDPLPINVSANSPFETSYAIVDYVVAGSTATGIVVAGLA
ncbi:hypothetical protein ASF58_23210 [Methylobacterium sp. Leaf125]|uniref:hypothetical protein n=1 Tax=Methylobacterium sp. Leaf125 TaxID=1736265 RepID=UPI0006F4ABD5|nr:hypothetical protein [Methylobacterium sp. Leaf125]KQQ39052.1 hypothetical protein ASF58_23210 [Methylobacterium sp. Leaf125]